jgi:putative ABC transport system permease protein
VKAIEARDQVALGARRGLQLALVGMSYRMFRSAVTVAILALAVAFLVHMVCHGILAQETERSAWERLAVDRVQGERITRLITVDTNAAIEEQLHAGSADRLREFGAFSGLDPGEIERARATARELHRLGQELLELPVTARAALLADLTPAELFARTTNEARVRELEEDLSRVRVRLNSTKDIRGLLLERRPAMLGAIERVRRGHARAVEELERAYPGRRMSDLVREPPQDFADTLAALGFSIDAQSLTPLAAYATREAHEEAVEKLLLDGEVRATVARETRADPGDVSMEMLVREIDDRDEARWLVAAMRAADPTFSLDEGTLLQLLSRARDEARLLSVSSEPVEHEGALFGLSERNQWLIALSFLVCVVGVANAMLMSVTERFTEIATMKCLGAMDRFVMVLFVFEAMVQGVIGGAIGIVGGFFLALVRGLFEYGTFFLAGFGATGPLLLGIGLSFVVGVLLAALAAVGPAFIAARLPPMEAMRVD